MCVGNGGFGKHYVNRKHFVDFPDDEVFLREQGCFLFTGGVPQYSTQSTVFTETFFHMANN